MATYSEGVAAMRHGIEAFLTPPDQDHHHGNGLFHVLFSGMTAKPVADAFLGMATIAAKLTPDEISIRNVLRRRLEHHTSFRNDLAHAEWSLGWENAETGRRCDRVQFGSRALTAYQPWSTVRSMRTRSFVKSTT